MNQNHKITARDQDIIVLGAASVETQGPFKRVEDAGGTIPMEIAVE